MFNPHDYTVGWICALVTEYVAVQVFLDETHAAPEYVSNNDNNNYTLGRIGKHNVVITILPFGKYSLSSAATVARDMLHSFPNVRVGLLIGMGGGALTSENDIRLWGLSGWIQGQDFKVTKFLDRRPPTVLRTAVGALEAQDRIRGHRIPSDVAEALD